MPDIPKALLERIQWCASHKDNEYVLDNKQARKLLLALESDWCPEVEKESTGDMAFRSFKRGLEERYGRKNVRFSRSLEEAEDGRTYVCVTVSVRSEAGWPDETVALLVKASGFSRFFEESGSGAGMGWRDICFISRRRSK